MPEPRKEASVLATRTPHEFTAGDMTVRYYAVTDLENDPIFKDAPEALKPVAVWVSEPDEFGELTILVSGQMLPQVGAYAALHEHIEFARDGRQTPCMQVEAEVLELIPPELRLPYLEARAQMFGVLAGMSESFAETLAWVTAQIQTLTQTNNPLN
jgi:hypothetical protein